MLLFGRVSDPSYSGKSYMSKKSTAPRRIPSYVSTNYTKTSKCTPQHIGSTKSTTTSSNTKHSNLLTPGGKLKCVPKNPFNQPPCPKVGNDAKTNNAVPQKKKAVQKPGVYLNPISVVNKQRLLVWKCRNDSTQIKNALSGKNFLPPSNIVKDQMRQSNPPFPTITIYRPVRALRKQKNKMATIRNPCKQDAPCAHSKKFVSLKDFPKLFDCPKCRTDRGVSHEYSYSKPFRPTTSHRREESSSSAETVRGTRQTRKKYSKKKRSISTKKSCVPCSSRTKHKNKKYSQVGIPDLGKLRREILKSFKKSPSSSDTIVGTRYCQPRQGTACRRSRRPPKSVTCCQDTTRQYHDPDGSETICGEDPCRFQQIMDRAQRVIDDIMSDDISSSEEIRLKYQPKKHDSYERFPRLEDFKNRKREAEKPVVIVPEPTTDTTIGRDSDILKNPDFHEKPEKKVHKSSSKSKSGRHHRRHRKKKHHKSRLPKTDETTPQESSEPPEMVEKGAKKTGTESGTPPKADEKKESPQESGRTKPDKSDAKKKTGK